MMAHGTAVVRGNRTAVMKVGDQGVLGEEIFEREIGGPALIAGVQDDEPRGRLDSRAAHQFGRRHPFPDVAQSRPTRHAMEVGEDLDTRQLAEFLERES